MLAVCTTSSLVLLDPPTLKKAPLSAPATTSFFSIPTASIWAPDNSVLFVANDNSVQRYDPAGTLLNTIPSEHSIAALASKDRGATVVIGSGDQVSVLDAASGRVACSLETHSGAVSGLALAPDGAALASTSGAVIPEVHVHNLAGALPHVELQGLPRRGEVRACTFHPHSKARLLVAVGALLLVYDVAKPSAPLKTIQLDKKGGEVVAISCSPFSKSLVAVGCSAGVVHLVDLDREKGLFRTIPLEARLSSLVFSPEGAALYAGTDDNKLLILDLRALDKPPKSIDVGAPVVCMSVQRKLKPSESPARTRPSASATALSKRRVEADAAEKPARSAAGSSTMPSSGSAPLLKTRTTAASKTATSPGPSPNRVPRTRTISATSSPSKPTVRPRVDNSKSTPPEPKPRAPSTVSKGDEPAVPATAAVTKRPRTVSAATSASSRATASSAASKITRISSSTSATSVEATSPRTRKVSTLSPPKSPVQEVTSRAATPADKPSTSRIRKTIAMLSAANQDKPAGPSSVRSRTTSTTSTRSAAGPVASSSATSRASASGSTNTVSPSTTKTHVRSRTLSSRSSASNVTSRSTKADPRSAVNPSPIPPVPPLPEAFKDQEQLTGIDIKWTISRTPSPELQDGTDVMNTPMPMAKRNKGKGKEPMQPDGAKTNVLGLGTPELKRWIESEGDSADESLEEPTGGRRVEFLQAPENEVQIENIRIVREDAPDDAPAAGVQGEAKATVQMTLQISPRRSSEKLSPNWTPLPSLFSPSRTASMHGGAEAGGSSSAGAPPSPAHELLQSLIRDAMYDFRRETKAEIIGLHLDLVRMGRGWRKELREALESWGEELKEIRRENELLRQENERLRRGY